MREKLPAKIVKESDSIMERLAAIEDQLAPILAEKRALEKRLLGEVKTAAKEYVVENGLPDGDYVSPANPRFITNVKTRRITQVEDVSKITDENLIEEVELDMNNITQRDGKLYQRVGNIQAYNEQYKKLGKTADGFTEKTSIAISFKLDGKAI